jgi:hypothetical protein
MASYETELCVAQLHATHKRLSVQMTSMGESLFGIYPNLHSFVKFRVHCNLDRQQPKYQWPLNPSMVQSGHVAA